MVGGCVGTNFSHLQVRGVNLAGTSNLPLDAFSALDSSKKYRKIGT